MSDKSQTGSKGQLGQVITLTGSQSSGAGDSGHAPPPELVQTPVPALNLSAQVATVWSGSPLTVDGVDEYEAFVTRGYTIKNHSFVYVRGERGARHIAYINSMFERKGEKLMKVQWFWQQHEMRHKHILQQANAISNEIFFDRRMEVLSVRCIDDFAVVLTTRDWERLSTTNALVQTSGYICRREINGKKLSDFDVGNLEGYHLQGVFEFADDLPMSNQNNEM